MKAFLMIALLSSCTPAFAATDLNLIQNGGFDTGDFTGWTLDQTCPAPKPFSDYSPSCGVVGSGTLIPGSYTMMGGYDYAVGEGSVGYDWVGNLRLSQQIQMDAGFYQTNFFLGNDSAMCRGGTTNPLYGSAAVFLNGQDIGAVPVGSFACGQTMQEFVGIFTIDTPGVYDIAYSLRETIQALSFDNFSLVDPPSPVPEPRIWAMMLAGFLLVGLAFRKGRGLVKAEKAS